MNEKASVILFGPVGQGKSSIANMLIQGNINLERNAFEINESAVGTSVTVNFSENDDYIVYDTIRIGESCYGNVPHEEAVKTIRNYFSNCEVPFKDL
ncbi:8920_t:CDS:2 [Funneliformis geosporum]|uniref:8920_t:CDS:1 n=1 Tax=Funneliformis geosporum TaxID=1117311 RepID=A0A9W4WTH6_9GLOM|nr:8920_t:CDS:2 [Funneliformis geosporum]